jgi:ABC-2 type transport system permease protein
VRTNIIIGTNIDQTAVTSGNLIRTWEKENRNYFEYHSNGPMINFYAILSGRYELRQDQWHPKNQADQAPVDLEIYYHPRHTYNLDRMMNGMKASLAYYSSNFSPYPDQQLRIVEFPRYEDFAQSFPNTIPFSESIGFLLDIDDSTDVDMTFFVTAHEVAHQWWGLQVETANVKGRSFVLETLSQYSALMVFKNQFSQVKVDKLIAHQQDLYDKGKGKAKIEEVPLYLVGNEEYIYYNKGIIAMYNLQKYIGEDKVNQALRSFIKDWNNRNGEIKCKTDRYATSEDLISYILENTPEQKIDKVLKLFKEIY